MKGQPFSRAMVMAAAVSAILSRAQGNYSAQQAGLVTLGPYESRGKGGKRPHRSVGTKAHQRLAAKRRNVLRFRGHAK